MHFNHLASTLYGKDEMFAKNLCCKIDEKIDCFANGDLDHAANVIALLWKLSKAGKHTPGVPPLEFDFNLDDVSPLTLSSSIVQLPNPFVATPYSLPCQLPKS